MKCQRNYLTDHVKDAVLMNLPAGKFETTLFSTAKMIFDFQVSLGTGKIQLQTLWNLLELLEEVWWSSTSTHNSKKYFIA